MHDYRSRKSPDFKTQGWQSVGVRFAGSESSLGSSTLAEPSCCSASVLGQLWGARRLFVSLSLHMSTEVGSLSPLFLSLAVLTVR